MIGTRGIPRDKFKLAAGYEDALGHVKEAYIAATRDWVLSRECPLCGSRLKQRRLGRRPWFAGNSAQESGFRDQESHDVNSECLCDCTESVKARIEGVTVFQAPDCVRCDPHPMGQVLLSYSRFRAQAAEYRTLWRRFVLGCPHIRIPESMLRLPKWYRISSS